MGYCREILLTWVTVSATGPIDPAPRPATVVSQTILTSASAHKPKRCGGRFQILNLARNREMILELAEGDRIEYFPGDAFYMVPENMDEEVTFILDRSAGGKVPTLLWKSCSGREMGKFKFGQVPRTA